MQSLHCAELSIATVRQNTALARKVAELEQDLDVWKQSRTVLSEALELTKRKYEDEIASLKSHSASGDSIANTEVSPVVNPSLFVHE